MVLDFSAVPPPLPRCCLGVFLSGVNYGLAFSATDELAAALSSGLIKVSGRPACSRVERILICARRESAQGAR